MIADLKYALRMLLKSPGFTIVAAVTLALGIGANTAIFSVVDTVLLRSLPFKDPEQLVRLWSHGPSEPDAKYVHSFPDYVDFRERTQSFTALAAYTRTGGILNVAEAQQLEGLAVYADIFAVLGTQPMLGRAYTRAEDKAGAPPVVVLTQRMWARAFASDPKIVGQQISISHKSYTVVGVMPPGWKYPLDVELDYIIPLEPQVPQAVARRGSQSFTITGRLKPGVSVEQANAEVRALSIQLAQQYPESNQNRFARVVSLHEDTVGNVKPALLVMLGAVALVLLIACANVANLLLARAAARSREIGIRTALGASRAAIVRQLLAESFLLAVIGGAGGLLLAWWGIDILSALGPKGVPRLAEIRIDASVCAFTCALAVLSTLVFGLVPALQVSRPNVSGALQQGAKGSTGGVHSNRMRAALVVSQVSLSLLLLAGAGLLIRSFFNLRATDPGFNPARITVVDVTAPRVRYPEPDQQRRFHEQLLAKLRALPGVEAVGGVEPLPFSGNSRGSSFTIAGAPPAPQGTDEPAASRLTVTPGYFETMKIPLRAGRTINDRDTADSQPVIVVNQTLARTYFPNADPVGQHLLFGSDGDEPNLPVEIVGVVGDSHHEAIATKPGPEMYLPHTQDAGRRVNYVFRTATETLSGIGIAVKRAVHEVDKDLYVPKPRAMQEFLAADLAQPRFNMMLLAVFAGVAMILAAIGIYGVIAYSVAQRTREIGIRMALGAQRAEMLGMVLRQSLTLVAIGLTIGLLASLAATRLMSSLLYGVGTTDLSTYALVMVLLGGAALLASYIPARRAMKVDPMGALRYE